MTEKAVQFDWEKITGPLGETEDIFKDEIKRIEKLCNGYDFEKNSSNVISIVGNRGCGKTSLIKAVQKHFKPKEDKEKNISDEEEARYKNFYVTDTIDPSIFDDTLLIPEFFISVLAQEVKNAKENSNGEFAEFYKKLNEIMEVISHIKSNKERFYEDNHPSDIVRTIQKRYRFDKLLKELIISFYKAIGKDEDTKMIVCIDDLDLVSNKYVYRMIEDIQKWLNKNCIVILSFREVQLLNIIQDQFITQNINLIDNNIISISEIRDQAIQFYEKQMPVSRRIYLKGQTEFFNETARDILKPFVKNMREIDKSENDNKKDVECTDNEFIWKCLKNEEINFHDFMEKMVRRKVALPLDPVDEKERVHLIYPNGLREMLAFVRMLDEMPEIRDEDGNVLKENLQQNLKNYQNYVLSRAKANLNMEYYSVLEEWLKTSVGNKNYYICSKMDKFLKDSVEKVSKSKENSDFKNSDGYHDGVLVYIENTQPYNVMLGDVVQFIEKIKVFFSYSEQMMYICYLIKLLYSIELLSSFLELSVTDLSCKTEAPLSDEEETNFENEDDYESLESDEYCLPNTTYSKLINCKFMPDDYLYAPKSAEKQGVSNAIDHIFIEKNDKEDKLQTIVEKIAYSRRKVKSKIWDEARPTISDKKGFGRFKTLYHDVIFIKKDGKSEWNYNEDVYYKTDPLSAVLKREYLSTVEEECGYVFYSLFDVDVFMRITFYNKQNEKLRFLYNKINWVLCGTEENDYSQYEQSLKAAISHLYKINGYEVFSKELIAEINLFDKFKEEIPSEIVPLMRKIYKEDIYYWRKLIEEIKNISLLSEDDRKSAKKIEADLNMRNRRKLRKEEEDCFKYFLQKYPEARDLIK